MADKPQNASLAPDNGTRFFSNILIAVIILICISIAVIAIHVAERQNNEELRNELLNLKTQVGM